MSIMMQKKQRKITNPIRVGSVTIGGGADISVQSMLNISLCDTARAVEQAKALERAGCDIIRAAVESLEAASCIPAYKKEIHAPFVADIHFDYRIAIAAVKNGADKVRINPGNIGGKEKIRSLVSVLKDYAIPVRIGVNSGSLEKDLLKKYGHPTPEALVESAVRHIAMFDEFSYHQVAVSIKSSDVVTTIQANRLFAEQYPYPLHLGVTEAGAHETGLVRSAVGLGTLLSEGIGDTIRVSLTGDPVQEVYAAKEILYALNLRPDHVHIVSCPTCARCKTDTLTIVEELKEATKHIHKPIILAVMGCAVNGPGEARESDVGVACGEGSAVLFKKGEVLRKIPTTKICEEILKEIETL